MLEEKIVLKKILTIRRHNVRGLMRNYYDILKELYKKKKRVISIFTILSLIYSKMENLKGKNFLRIRNKI